MVARMVWVMLADMRHIALLSINVNTKCYRCYDAKKAVAASAKRLDRVNNSFSFVADLGLFEPFIARVIVTIIKVAIVK
jgi:hypothetical protein